MRHNIVSHRKHAEEGGGSRQRREEMALVLLLVCTRLEGGLKKLNMHERYHRRPAAYQTPSLTRATHKPYHGKDSRPSVGELEVLVGEGASVDRLSTCVTRKKKKKNVVNETNTKTRPKLEKKNATFNPHKKQPKNGHMIFIYTHLTTVLNSQLLYSCALTRIIHWKYWILDEDSCTTSVSLL